MAQIDEGLFRDWQYNEKLSAEDYKREREILRVAINDTDDKIELMQPDKFEAVKETIGLLDDQVGALAEKQSNLDSLADGINDTLGKIQQDIIEVADETANIEALVTKSQVVKNADYEANKIVINQQIADKASQIAVDSLRQYFENKINNLIDGSPDGVFSTLAELQSTYPTYTRGVYVVNADGKWYFWLDGFGWTAGGTYQSVQLANSSVTRDKIADTYLSTLPYLDSSQDLNTLKKDGWYIVTTATNKPTQVGSNTCVLEVIVHHDITYPSRWVLQRISELNTPNKIYVRMLDLKTPTNSTSWTDMYLIQNARLVDGSVTRSKLDDAFRSSTTYLDSSTDLNSVKKDGLYVVTTATNKPSQVGTNTCFLSVEVYRENTNALRWVIQTVYDFTDPTKKYVRKLDTSNSANNTQWVEPTVTISDKSVSRSKLADNFLGITGYLDSATNLNTFSRDGIYLVTSATNKPTQVGSNNCFLENYTYRLDTGVVRWVIQKAYDYNNPNRVYVRKVDLNNSAFNTAWTEIKASALSKFDQKKAICIGDSITEGTGSSNVATKSYVAILAGLTGMTITNAGTSGATWQNDGNATNDAMSVVTKSSTLDFSDKDYVILAAGTNDFGRDNATGRPIGTDTDMVDSTLCGAMNLTIKNILTANPLAKIAIVAPLWRQRNSGQANSLGFYLTDYVDAIIKIAKKYHLPVLNQFEECSINEYNYASYFADGLHPNDAGHELMARKITGFLNSVY